ncbi:MAG TPA: 5-guanidino-2-oxopentanoate decarboxylase [Steroidobacteraceae bacterium]|nr:5-guanidino-2-oxopentanoate decarboxylase [Steroidobacteraceae bacterium]
MSASSSVGRYLVELLAANGIDTVFGIPGVHTLELYRGLALTGMRHVLVRHEQNAGFAADGYARVTGRPAAAFVISGPGVTNALTAVAQAYSDSVPLIVVASAPVRASLGKGWGVLHELPEQLALGAGVTGLARSASSAEDVRDHLRAIFASFHGGRPRPAYLQIPLDLLAEPTDLRAERFASLHAPRAPSREQIERAAGVLATARRPLIIAGGGARGAGESLLRLVEATDGYLVTSTAGKGVLSESHPANLGASLPYRATQELVLSADVIIAVGTELSETDFYTGTRLPMTGRLIRIDLDPAKLADQYGAEYPVWGDARACLEAIAIGLTKRQGWRTEAGPAATHRATLEKSFGRRTRARLSAVTAIREGVPADGVVFSDQTQIAYLGNYAYRADRPGSWFHPCGYGALGFALPAALGAKIAQPERAVVALAGDFGLQFTLQDLMTAVELELTLPVVVWNNEALGQIRDDMRAAGIPPVGVVARNPDFLALARAFGAEGVRAAGPGPLTETIHRALSRKGPTLIEAVEADFMTSVT